MCRLVLFLALAAGLDSAEHHYELQGRILSESEELVYAASVSLFGATTPFHVDSLSDARGRFRFRGLLPGQYTVAVFIPGLGEARKTVEVGPGTADCKGRVAITISIDPPLVSKEAVRDGAVVSARELSIPESARREYTEAQKRLAQRDTAAAVAHLLKAVAISPLFSAAWNNLGTIAYQTREYPDAEADFRKALGPDPHAFEPLVNLGGVLLTERKNEEALPYNLKAAMSRPHDALANAQLGMNYFALGNLDQSEKYLQMAKRIDPAHFSHPQLTLAQIYLRRHQRAKAVEELRDFLRRHPDSPQAVTVRDELLQLDK